MNFDDWMKEVPPSITADPLWKMKVYQLALFAGDVGWFDVTKLSRDRRTISLSDQLYRALGSIGANLAEGYSYGTGTNRARMYEYSLGSAREARGWYRQGRHILGNEVANHRMNFLARIAQMLMVIVPQERGRTLKEDSLKYTIPTSDTDFDNLPSLESLLTTIPLSPKPNARRKTQDVG